jgi:hypothetical protein
MGIFERLDSWNADSAKPFAQSELVNADRLLFIVVLMVRDSIFYAGSLFQLRGQDAAQLVTKLETPEKSTIRALFLNKSGAHFPSSLYKSFVVRKSSRETYLVGYPLLLLLLSL